MKAPYCIIAIVTALTAIGFSTSAHANPPAQQQVVARASQSAATTAKADASRVPMMANYWDAKEWDREGGASFWHSTEEPRQMTSKKAKRKAHAKKGGGLVKKLFKR